MVFTNVSTVRPKAVLQKSVAKRTEGGKEGHWGHYFHLNFCTLCYPEHVLFLKHHSIFGKRYANFKFLVF